MRAGKDRIGSDECATEVTTTVGTMSVPNEGLLAWVRDMAAMCGPDRVVWVDGSAAEKERLTAQAVAEGRADAARPREAPLAVTTRGRTQRRGASSTSPSSARRRRTRPGRPTTGWPPTRRTPKLRGLFTGAMKGGRCTSSPTRWGPIGSALREDRHRDHRQHLRGAQHGHHDAHGQRPPSMLGGPDGFNRGLH